MDLWEYILIFDYFVSLTGLVANLVYFNKVVMNKFYDGYWRIASFIISTGMITVIVSHIASSLICLSYDGSLFPSRHCGKTQLYFLMDYFNAHGQFSIPAGIFIMIFERYGSVLFPAFRLTFNYKIGFSALLLSYLSGSYLFIYLWRINFSPVALLSGYSILTVLYVLSFAFSIHLYFFSKKMYYKTLGQISLEQRYLLSESYDLCQSCLIPTFCLLAINISLFVSFWLFVGNIIPFTVMYQYFLVNAIVLNISATLFPILFLAVSKLNKKRNNRRNGTVHAADVRQLDGNKISTVQTQNEYFQQLQSAWA